MKTAGAFIGPFALLMVVPTALPQTAAARLPSMLEDFVADVVRPTPAQRKDLMAGQPITKLLDGDPNREVVVFGAVWINAPIQRYTEAVQDIETFERGKGFVVTKRIGSPPSLEDFSAMHIPEDDLNDLRNCKVGDCKIKLSEEALRRIQSAVDWKAPNRQAVADTEMRQLALEYVQGYLEGGNERLAVYRDGSRPTFVAQEFRLMIDEMPELATRTPDLRRYLLDYPKFQLPDAMSFLYWQEVQFGLKPTFRINHLTIQQNPGETIVTSKMLYASHYFWTALELRALVPDPSRGAGFWFFTISRSRSDGLGGFQGRLIRGRVRSEAENGTVAALNATRKRLEH
jgi:hypothetical protein